MSRTRRRIFVRLSLRALLLVIAAASIWLAISSQRVRNQRKAVARIEALGGSVVFDYEIDDDGKRVKNARTPGPSWLRIFLTEDWFRSVVHVDDNAVRSLFLWPELCEISADGPLVTKGMTKEVRKHAQNRFKQVYGGK